MCGLDCSQHGVEPQESWLRYDVLPLRQSHLRWSRLSPLSVVVTEKKIVATDNWTLRLCLHSIKEKEEWATTKTELFVRNVCVMCHVIFVILASIVLFAFSCFFVA